MADDVKKKDDQNQDDDGLELVPVDTEPQPIAPTVMHGVLRLLPQQIRAMQKDVPAKHVQKTKKFGGTYDTIKHQYAVQHLNRVFFGIWSWEETSREVLHEDRLIPMRDELGDIMYSDKKDSEGNPRPKLQMKSIPVSVVVHGRITVTFAGGLKVSKDGTGGAELARYGFKHERAGEVISWANAYKSAGSDALKKAASRFGMFPNVYKFDADEDVVVDIAKLRSTLDDEEFKAILPMKEKIEAVDNTTQLMELAGKFDEMKLNPRQWRYLDATVRQVMSDFRAKA